MMNFDWTIGVLIFSPFAAFLVSILGVFDIKKETAEKLFKECQKKLREEKIKIWKKLITIRDSTEEENEVNNQLMKTMEDEERYEKLNIILKNCRQYFNFYFYYLLPLLLCIGIILLISKNIFYDFFSKESIVLFLSIFAILALLFVVFGIVFLMFKKKKLTESFDKVISSPTSPINL